MRKKSEQGMVMLEFAVASTLFGVLLIWGLQLLLLAYTFVALQFSVHSGLRWGVIGSTQVDPQSGTQLSRGDSIALRIRRRGSKFGIGMSDAEIRVCPVEQFSCQTPHAGAPGQMIYASVSKRISLFFPAHTVKLFVSGLARNEPF